MKAEYQVSAESVVKWKSFLDLHKRGQNFFRSDVDLLETTDTVLLASYNRWQDDFSRTLRGLLASSPGTEKMTEYIQFRVGQCRKTGSNPLVLDVFSGLNTEQEMWDVLDKDLVEGAEYFFLLLLFDYEMKVIEKNLSKQLKPIYSSFADAFYQEVKRLSGSTLTEQQMLCVYNVHYQIEVREHWLHVARLFDNGFESYEKLREQFDSEDDLRRVISSLKSIRRWKDWPEAWCQKYGDSLTMKMLELTAWHVDRFYQRVENEIIV